VSLNLSKGAGPACRAEAPREGGPVAPKPRAKADLSRRSPGRRRTCRVPAHSTPPPCVRSRGAGEIFSCTLVQESEMHLMFDVFAQPLPAPPRALR